MSYMSYDMGSIEPKEAKRLLKRYEPMVHHIVSKFCVSKGHFSGVDNQDLLQVGRIGVLQGIVTYKEGKKALDTWVYQIARQHVSEEVRRASGISRDDWTAGRWNNNYGARMLSQDHPEYKELPGGHEEPRAHARMVAMEQAEKVPERYKELTELYAQGFTLDEIASWTGISRQAVYWKLQAARRKWNI